MALRDLPALSPDGVRIRLLANLELSSEIETARNLGAEGIGLYRSEFFYLRGGSMLPDEDGHYREYRDLAERCAPGEVVIRTLDLGGEEYSSRVLEQRESNPVLGLRGIRLSLQREDLFRTQARAILRAAVHGRVRMMFPMVAALEEFRQARSIVESVRAELRREGIPFAPDVPIGIMVEIPAAALIADRLADEVDFFSIGTNDLIQYTLAIDRGNPSVAYLYQPLHPAVLALIRQVVDAAATRRRPVSVCGEMAADPVAALVLASLGVTDLSMSPVAIPGVKQVIRCVPIARIGPILEEALQRGTVAEIDEAVRSRILTLLPADATCAL